MLHFPDVRPQTIIPDLSFRNAFLYFSPMWGSALSTVVCIQRVSPSMSDDQMEVRARGRYGPSLTEGHTLDSNRCLVLTEPAQMYC